MLLSALLTLMLHENAFPLAGLLFFSLFTFRSVTHRSRASAHMNRFVHTFNSFVLSIVLFRWNCVKIITSKIAKKVRERKIPINSQFSQSVHVSEWLIYMNSTNVCLNLFHIQLKQALNINKLIPFWVCAYLTTVRKN